jgi:lysozyme
MDEQLTYTADGLIFTEGFEGCRLVAYQDTRGVWTIGYGHTMGVKSGDTCTQDEANDFLQRDILWAADCVNKNINITLNQNEFNALTDFVFNVGCGNFINSTLIKDLNVSNFNKVATDLEMWDISAGSVCAGLLRRRVAEANEFAKI